jgi:hypothetical protein
MKTLKELVEAQKCRHGFAAGTTKAGAYWLSGKVTLRRCGGDGVGQSGSDVEYFLALRHYRSGEVRAVVQCETWHQNDGTNNQYVTQKALLDCLTVEDVIVELKKGAAFSGDGGRETVYSDSHENELSEMLTGLGLPVAAPAPDEAPASV